uniref:Vigilin n=1 Tax=Soboliphyme baturini TaxID=241478 RepID=A0A183IEE5_9BILA
LKILETTIELCQNKDHSLTVVVSGKRQAVEEARKLIVQSLQTQANREFKVPKEYHRALIGREGRHLQELEKSTDCRILVPNRDVASDVIKIMGPREGIDKAIHEIQKFADEQSKLAQEHLLIPKIYYPWIKGPNNETVDRIIQENGVRVNIPPRSANNEVIIITGEKTGVYKAANEIREIYEEKVSMIKNYKIVLQFFCSFQKATIGTVQFNVAVSQHRYIIGPQRAGITEILRETGVSVEVPPEESKSNIITLRGDKDKLGLAATMVLAKASSIITAEISCPVWLHKYIIGSKGSGIRQIIGDHSKVQVTFDQEGYVLLEGIPEEVKRTKDFIADRVKQLEEEMTFDTAVVHPSLHGHIIGRSGTNSKLHLNDLILVARIRQETGVIVVMPDPNTHSAEIRLEGTKGGVAKAKEEILALAEKKENEKSRDILIENRFHKQLIGVKGESIKELHQLFPEVIINFPDPGRKSDVVTLRGPKDEVDKCYRHMHQIYKELIESNYQISIPIYKDFFKHIIGKGGANIKKIREETNTRIDIPAESSESDVIIITGKKANAEKAERLLQKMQNELSSIVTVEIQIPHKMHSGFISAGGRLIHSISEDCGGVQIKFPPENTHSDCITIRGPKDGVEKAKKVLLDLAKDREASSFTAEVKAKPEMFGYLIGSGGTRIKKIRDSYPGIRILIPRPQDEDQETIHLIGRKDDVGKVKKQLEELVNELNMSVEITMDIDPKWHKYFLSRSRNALREIQERNCGVAIIFPKINCGCKVTLKGPKECVEQAKLSMEEIVADLEAQVTVPVHISPKHYRSLLGNRGANIQDLCQKCKVQIKFPERARDHSAAQSMETGEENVEEGTVGTASPAVNDIVRITGRQENCDKAIELLLAEIPITEVVNVPFDFHGSLIGRQGIEIRKLMNAHNVNIQFAAFESHSDEIRVTGRRPDVSDAIAAIMKRVEELEEELKDKELRSYSTKVSVPAAYIPKLIGPKGREIQRIRAKYGVQIAVPPTNDDEADECKEEIDKMVEDEASLFTQEITLDCRIHNRLIGQKGKNIKKIVDQFNVEIRLPKHDSPDPNLVVVAGQDEDSVYDCIDQLRKMEEEYLQASDLVDRYAYRDPQRMANSQTLGGEQPILEIVNAPWQQGKADAVSADQQIPPDVANIQEFPAIGNEAGTMNASARVWGQRRA